jgi:hypothetical protein
MGTRLPPFQPLFQSSVKYQMPLQQRMPQYAPALNVPTRNCEVVEMTVYEDLKQKIDGEWLGDIEL